MLFLPARKCRSERCAILHWVIVIWIVLSLMAIPVLLAYRLGKQAGVQEGYLKGYQEGETAGKKRAS